MSRSASIAARRSRSSAARLLQLGLESCSGLAQCLHLGPSLADFGLQRRAPRALLLQRPGGLLALSGQVVALRFDRREALHEIRARLLQLGPESCSGLPQCLHFGPSLSDLGLQRRAPRGLLLQRLGGLLALSGQVVALRFDRREALQELRVGLVQLPALGADLLELVLQGLALRTQLVDTLSGLLTRRALRLQLRRGRAKALAQLLSLGLHACELGANLTQLGLHAGDLLFPSGLTGLQALQALTGDGPGLLNLSQPSLGLRQTGAQLLGLLDTGLHVLAGLQLGLPALAFDPLEIGLDRAHAHLQIAVLALRLLKGRASLRQLGAELAQAFGLVATRRERCLLRLELGPQLLRLGPQRSDALGVAGLLGLQALQPLGRLVYATLQRASRLGKLLQGLPGGVELALQLGLPRSGS